jgi:hypothetical protein
MAQSRVDIVADPRRCQVAQKLARHSTIVLTMDRYSHVQLGELNQAVGMLPSLSVFRHTLTGISGPSDFTTIPVCPEVCPANDSSCGELTTIDTWEQYDSEWPDDEVWEEIMEKHVFYLTMVEETEMNRNQPSSELVSVSEEAWHPVFHR